MQWDAFDFLNREKHALTMTHLGWTSSSDRFSSSAGDSCTWWWDHPVGGFMAWFTPVRQKVPPGCNLCRSLKIHLPYPKPLFVSLISREKKDGRSNDAIQMKPHRDINENTKHKEFSFLTKFHEACLDPPISFINHRDLINSMVLLLKTDLEYNDTIHSKPIEHQLIKTTQ